MEVRSGDELFENIEVEDSLQELKVVVHTVDNLYFEVTKCVLANLREVHFREVCNVQLGDLGGVLINCVCDVLWRWPTIGNVVLDAKVCIWTSGVVTGGKDEGTCWELVVIGFKIKL